MHLTIEIFIVFVFAIILLIGAATRSFSRFIGIPFTILMLTLGFASGMYIRHYTQAHGFFAFFHHSEAGHSLISPELILFTFLPVLIFESAFSLDAHVFRRSLTNIVLLAGPALFIAAVLTAYLMLSVTPAHWAWTMSYALLFGALINATDPVAVVALLRELGISKRLVTLIEGESLLNDGTAIVLFSVFLGISIGGAGQLSWLAILLQLAKVVVGGLFVGWLLATIISRWIGKVFNDPLVEITLMMAMAYLAMIIAEGMLHVSGVMALVISGLYMSSVGRTRISPEVMHFLHEFWEMMSYIANSMIFFLVGLVIALQIKSFHWNELWIALIAYVGIMAIRGGILFAFRPIFALFKNPVSVPNVTIATWGGLRGAVSLALALILSQTTALPDSFRQQVLLLTAVIVLITVVFNGGTMKLLLSWLGLDKPSLAAQIAANLAQVTVLNNVKNMIDELATSGNFRNVYWSDVRNEVNAAYAERVKTGEQLEAQIQTIADTEHEAEFWVKVINVERASYWHLFSKGLLSREAISILNHELDVQVDALKHGRIAPPKQRTPEPSLWSQWLQRMVAKFTFLQQRCGFIIFGQLVLNFNFCHAEEYAAKHVLEKIDALKGMEPRYEAHIRETYTDYLNNAKQRLEEMRADLPELTQALETYFAKRLTLNREREGIADLLKTGIIDVGVAQDALESVERRMEKLHSLPKYMRLPSAEELIREVPLFDLCDDQEQKQLASAFTEHVILKGSYLFHEGDKTNSLFIIVRGALGIYKGETLLTVLGGGDIVGEMALLTGQPRMASALAKTTVTVLEIKAQDFIAITKNTPRLLEQTWLSYSRHLLDNHLQRVPEFSNLNSTQKATLLAQTTLHEITQDDSLMAPSNVHYAFVVLGDVQVGDHAYPAQSFIALTSEQILTSNSGARLLFICLSGDLE